MSNKNAAEMLLGSKGYPENVMARMHESFHAEQYQQVMQIAADFDILRREKLEDKITLVPPDRTYVESLMDSEDLPRDVAEHRAILDGKLKEATYRAEGLEEEFASAAEAIEAYKKANNIPIPDKSKHTFKSKPYFPDRELQPQPALKDMSKVIEEAEVIDLNEEYGIEEESVEETND